MDNKKSIQVLVSLPFKIETVTGKNEMISCYIPKLDLYFSVDNEEEIEITAKAMIESRLKYLNSKKPYGV